MLISEIMTKVTRAHKRSYFVIAILVLPFFLATIYGGCSDGNNNCLLLSEVNLLNSECLAEDLNELCLGLICQSNPTTSIPILFRSSCSALDCSTLECNDQSFTELGFDPEGMLLSTVILEGENLGNVKCQFFQQQ